MTTKVKLDTGQKSEFRKSLPVIDDGLRFSCAGEGCLTSEKCARWDHIYKGKYRNN